MAVRAINTYTATVTPQVAEAWFAFNYDKQRPIQDRHVAELAEAMRRGEFTTNTIKFGMYADRRVMINGQHTLRAIVNSNATIILPIQDFVVDGEPDIQKLYYNEDINRIRTFQDSARATSLGDVTGLSATQQKNIAAAIRNAKSGFGVNHGAGATLSFADLLEYADSWAWETKAIYNAITPCDGRDRNIITSRSVFPIALITMRYQPQSAREFWRQVAQDDGLDRWDARKTLRQWLLENAQRSRRITRIDPIVIGRGVASAWNAWTEHRDLKIIQPVRVAKGLPLPPLRLNGCGAFNGTQSPTFVPSSKTPNAHLSAEFGIE